ncbi:hypothetical protein HDU84_005742 [Entophlyctis sp. JEL0112]|nr:hypothetical protein HDU84_005742 [Entophlyctis sp. JEL0112]
MSLSYLTTYYDYADTACASPVSEINYYPTSSLAACQSAVANESECTTSDYFLAFRAACVTSGFRENGAEVFGDSTSYSETYVYSDATCSDATALVNLRQYRVGGCYQYSGTDGFGGKSRRGAVSPGATESFVINIYNDTACNEFYQSVTFLADNTTCQKTTFFNAGSYVKMHLVDASVTAGSNSTGSSTTSSSSSGGGGISTGTIGGIAAGAVIILLAVGAGTYYYLKRAKAPTQPRVDKPPTPPEAQGLPTPPTAPAAQGFPTPPTPPAAKGFPTPPTAPAEQGLPTYENATAMLSVGSSYA